MSENSIEFSLSNSEQRDSWLNSGHWTLDADRFMVLIQVACPLSVVEVSWKVWAPGIWQVCQYTAVLINVMDSHTCGS